MKRLFALLLCILMLLTACQTEPQTPSYRETDPSTDPTTEPVATTEATIPAEQPGVPLLDQGKAAGESGNLVYIPNPHMESMACPKICLFGHSLLVYEHTTDGSLLLKRISLDDGVLLAEASYPMSPSARVQVGNGLIGLCDSDSGQVLLLNESLETEKTYTVPLEGGRWYLNQELEAVYVFFDDWVVYYDLESNQAHILLDDMSFIQPFEMGSGYILFSYTDRTDRKTYSRSLNLSTATIETLPVENPVASGVRNGTRWLLRQDIAAGEYILVDQEEGFTFTVSEGLVELLPGRRQLLITDGSFRELFLYDLDGHFLSRCSLPKKEYASVGADLVWSGYWQGYFFRDTYDNTAHLMFWDPNTEQEGENLSLTAYGDIQSSEPILEKEIYQKAAELSQRFGVDIRIAEQCALDYSHYQAEAVTDPYTIRGMLRVLEQALGNYPEGFLQQLPFGTQQQIRIELVGALRGKEGMDTHPITVGGFAQECFDHYLIVFDSLSLNTQTVYHELSHVIDKHLAWDAALRPQALFSEDTWLSLQPKGFRYAYSYVEMPDEIAAFENSGYFTERYAMTFPTEDRATLMAAIISDKTLLWDNPGMAEKMRYYAACIRDCFNTEGWPETTIWEQ